MDWDQKGQRKEQRHICSPPYLFIDLILFFFIYIFLFLECKFFRKAEFIPALAPV